MQYLNDNKMVVIYTEDKDITTNLVMDWLSFLYKGEIKRINTDFFQIPTQSEFSCKGK